MSAFEEPATGLRLHALGLLAGFVTDLPRLFFPLMALLFSVRSSENGGAFMPFIIAAMLAVSFLFRWAAWIRFRYFVDEDDIRIESGFLSRNARSILYERIQDVSIEQGPVARILGLSEVKFETGGGKGDDGKLSFVSLEEAERLRELVRSYKSGEAAGGAKFDGDPGTANDALTEAQPLFAMDSKRLLTFGFYSFSLVIFAVLGGAAQQFDFLFKFDIYDIGAWLGIAEKSNVSLDSIGWSARIIAAGAALLALLIIGVLSGIIRTFIRDYGFRLDRNEKGFRRRRGLLTLTDVVMPAHRIQAATISTGPIRKRARWYALKFVSLADDGGKKNEDGGDHVAAPFATMAEIQGIADAAGVVLPDAQTSFHPSKGMYWFGQWLIIAALILAIIAGLMQFTNAGLSAIWLVAIAIILGVIYYADWCNNGYAYDDAQLFVRDGWWQQKLTIAPQVKIQSADVVQGPLTRLFGLAALKLGISGGHLQIYAMPLADARILQHAIMNAVAMVDYSDIGKKERAGTPIAHRPFIPVGGR